MKPLLALLLCTSLARASICDGPKYPDQGPVAAIIDALDAGRRTVLVEAPDSHMELNIQDAIATARSGGLDVRVIINGSIPQPENSTAAQFRWFHVPVWVNPDNTPDKSHTIIIDGTTLITGTFDFPSTATETTPDKLAITHDKALIEKAIAKWNASFTKARQGDSTAIPQLIGTTSVPSSTPVHLPPLPQNSPTPASSPTTIITFPRGEIGAMFENIGDDVTVTSVPNVGAAALAGVTVGDLVLQVDGKPFKKSSEAFVATMGEPGTTVRLTLVSLGSTTPHTIAIVREARMATDRPTVRRHPEPLYPPALAKITLPDHPTREQVHDYIRDILRASGNSNNQRIRSARLAFTPLPDPSPPQEQVSPQTMLAKVGRENIDLLIDLAPSRDGGYFIAPAITLLAEPQDIELLASRLDRAHIWLLDVFQQRGWTAKAVPAIKKILGENPSGLDSRVFTTLVSLRDPATYPDIAYCYKISDHKYKDLELLNQLPGFDVPAAVSQAWEYRKAAPKAASWGYPQDYEMAVVAASFGHRDAFDYLLECFIHGSSTMAGLPTPHEAILAVIDPAPNEELTTWYRNNRDYLRFDEQKKKYVAESVR